MVCHLFLHGYYRVFCYELTMDRITDAGAFPDPDLWLRCLREDGGRVQQERQRG